jgi:hypothetical protein
MTRRLDWEKAKRRGIAPTPERDTRKQQMHRQTAMAEFVAKHELACFKCKRNEGPWAKTGVSGHGPWAICMACVRSD